MVLYEVRGACEWVGEVGVCTLEGIVEVIKYFCWEGWVGGGGSIGLP